MGLLEYSCRAFFGSVIRSSEVRDHTMFDGRAEKRVFATNLRGSWRRVRQTLLLALVSKVSNMECDSVGEERLVLERKREASLGTEG